MRPACNKRTAASHACTAQGDLVLYGTQYVPVTRCTGPTDFANLFGPQPWLQLFCERADEKNNRFYCNVLQCVSNQVEFREDLKVLFEKAAVGGKPVTFLFNDNQVGTGLVSWGLSRLSFVEQVLRTRVGSGKASEHDCDMKIFAKHKLFVHSSLLSVCVDLVDQRGVLLGGHQQHPPIWRGPQPLRQG